MNYLIFLLDITPSPLEGGANLLAIWGLISSVLGWGVFILMRLNFSIPLFGFSCFLAAGGALLSIIGWNGGDLTAIIGLVVGLAYLVRFGVAIAIALYYIRF